MAEIYYRKKHRLSSQLYFFFMSYLNLDHKSSQICIQCLVTREKIVLMTFTKVQWLILKRYWRYSMDTCFLWISPTNKCRWQWPNYNKRHFSFKISCIEQYRK